MKRLIQIFQAALGVVVLIGTSLIAVGRFAWRTIRYHYNCHSSLSRSIIIVMLILISVGFIVFYAYNYYDGKYGRCSRMDKVLSTNVEVHAFRNHKYRVYNILTRKYTTPKINWVSFVSASDSLAVYAIPYKRGYINAYTGEVVINAELNDYQKAWVFSENLAAIFKDGKIGFINSRNEVVIPFMFDYFEDYDDEDTQYLFHQGKCVITNEEGDRGLIDTSGNWILEPKYDRISILLDNGYYIVVDDGKYGLLDASANWVYFLEYDDLVVLDSGIVLTKEGRMWQVDFDGNMLNPFLFDYSYWLNYPSGYSDSGEIEYTFAPYAKYEVNGCYGIMDRTTGAPITPALYADINMLSAELFEVQDPDTFRWHLVDKNGNRINYVK